MWGSDGKDSHRPRLADGVHCKPCCTGRSRGLVECCCSNLPAILFFYLFQKNKSFSDDRDSSLLCVFVAPLSSRKASMLSGAFCPRPH